MNLENLLQTGVEKEIITDNQRMELLKLVCDDTELRPLPAIVKTLYYIGGFITLIAMLFLMSYIIKHSSYFVILSLGTVYSFIFYFLGEFLWKKNAKTPSGIVYFLFISSIAFIILALEKMMGFFPHFSDYHIIDNYYELCRLPVILLSILVIIRTYLLQKQRPLSSLILPVVFSSYAIYLSILHFFMNDLLFETIPTTTFGFIFSVALIIVAFIIDKKTKADYSKWMYLIGAIAAIPCITANIDSFLLGQFITFILGLIYLYFGILIQRKSLGVIGIIGIIEFIIYLESNLLSGTILFTSSLIITGMMLLYTGVLYNQNSEKIRTFLENILPEKIRNYLPQNRS